MKASSIASLALFSSASAQVTLTLTVPATTTVITVSEYTGQPLTLPVAVTYLPPPELATAASIAFGNGVSAYAASTAAAIASIQSVQSLAQQVGAAGTTTVVVGTQTFNVPIPNTTPAVQTTGVPPAAPGTASGTGTGTAPAGTETGASGATTGTAAGSSVSGSVSGASTTAPTMTITTSTRPSASSSSTSQAPVPPARNASSHLGPVWSTTFAALASLLVIMTTMV